MVDNYTNDMQSVLSCFLHCILENGIDLFISIKKITQNIQGNNFGTTSRSNNLQKSFFPPMDVQIENAHMSLQSIHAKTVEIGFSV